MYAITGITGKTGGAVARSLLAERLPVRAVLRDEAKARSGDLGVATSPWPSWQRTALPLPWPMLAAPSKPMKP
jgi:uncharacterized protein YbjT (DUF2867 family)